MTDEELEKFVNELVSVETLAEIKALPLDTEAVFVKRPDDAKTKVLFRLEKLRKLLQDGNSFISDEGLEMLGQMLSLEELDLEWSGQITDEGLNYLHRLKNLRWLDIGFCRNITENGIKRLQEELPDCEVIAYQLAKP